MWVSGVAVKVASGCRATHDFEAQGFPPLRARRTADCKHGACALHIIIQSWPLAASLLPTRHSKSPKSLEHAYKVPDRPSLLDRL